MGIVLKKKRIVKIIESPRSTALIQDTKLLIINFNDAAESK